MLCTCAAVVMALVIEDTYLELSRRDIQNVGQLLLMQSGGSITARSSKIDKKALDELLVVATIKHELHFQFVKMKVLGLCFLMCVMILN